MVYVDASAYLSILNPRDSNHKKALSLAETFKGDTLITSQAVLGEVLTVGSMRYDRAVTIEFVERILRGETKVVLEDDKIVANAFDIFKKISNKNVSWVDCYSFAIIARYEVENVFSFDRHFKKYCREVVG